MNLIQVTKDKDFVSIKDMYDPKILSHKYLVNKYSKSIYAEDGFLKEFKKHKFNEIIMSGCLKTYLQNKGMSVGRSNIAQDKENFNNAIESFKEDFLKGNILSNPHLYIKI